MPDPAVEAARRAQDGPYAGCCKGFAKAAASEALKPIRELHRRVHSFVYRTDGMCEECDNVWPCETAELIYTTKELER